MQFDRTNKVFWKRVYTAFDPFRELKGESDPVWVNFAAVRGSTDILLTLGDEITNAERVTCQLFTGHIGCGKSTELRRLEATLKQEDYRVIYFAVDDSDLPTDTQYGDILLASARQIVQKLEVKDTLAEDSSTEDNADDAIPALRKLKRWLKRVCKDLVDLGLTELKLDEFSYETPDVGLGKISAKIKTNTSIRQKIRQQVEINSDSLIDILNQIIREALQDLPTDRLVLIIDNLDRIIEKFDLDSGRSNYDQIFVDHSDSLKALDCHVIYTVPISLAYSVQRIHMEARYKPIEVLPMIMARTHEGKLYDKGMEKLKEMIELRFQSAEESLTIQQAFESTEILENLCLMSGGHVRNLMMLMKAVLQNTDALPIGEKAARRAISDLRETYRQTITTDELELLAKVFLDKEIERDDKDKHRSLLFRRCILEYRYLDEEGGRHTWYDVHPLIFGIKDFQKALDKLSSTIFQNEPGV